ncbi:MAG: exosortase/archaeosortase family protein [Opitutales bacterium]
MESTNLPQAKTPSLPTAMIAIWLAPAVLWGVFFVQASRYWSPDSHYFYGWIVPPLAVYLIVQRWKNRPDVLARHNWLLGAVLLLLPIFLWLRSVAFIELFAGWTIPLWLLAGLAITISLAWLAAAGGARFALHFLPVFIFMLTALPWPAAIHNTVVYSMTGWIAGVTAFLIQFAGQPAELAGQQILVGSQVLEVGEACSGIRSLQALLMAGIFFGELGQWAWRKRAFLLGMAAAFAFVFNLARTLVLSWISLSFGPEAFDKWHDTTGAISFNLAWVSLMVIFFTIDKPLARPATPRPSAEQLRIPWRIAAPVAALALAVELALPLIYPVAQTPRYSIDFQQFSDGFVDKVDSEEVQELLGADGSQSFRVFSDEKLFEVYHLSWDQGVSISHLDIHTPDRCMGFNQGLEVLEIGDPFLADIGSRRMLVEPYRFYMASQGEALQVFRIKLNFHASDQFATDTFTGSHSLKSHWERLSEASNMLFRGGRMPRWQVHELTLIGLHGAPPTDEAWHRVAPLLSTVFDENST